MYRIKINVLNKAVSTVAAVGDGLKRFHSRVQACFNELGGLMLGPHSLACDLGVAPDAFP